MDNRVSVDAYEIPEVLGSFNARDILSAAMGDCGSVCAQNPIPS